MTARKLPIGIQDFACIRREGYIYVDKTLFVHRMVSEGKPYFLSRPRRFGKSLLVSTLKYYFEGKQELFEAIAGRERLAIADLEKEWKPYPVLHLDLTGTSYQSVESLDSRLASNLRVSEEHWGKDAAEDAPDARFFGLIRRACEQTKNAAVVLIDEYDKPLTDTLEKPKLHRAIRERLQGFYSVLKAADQWLRFVLLTGVTKFSKVSIFSTLNQLRDISEEPAFAGICGITESELAGNFGPEIEAFAEKKKKPSAEIRAEMRKRYNGYHFSKGESGGGENSTVSGGVYNPFSVLNTLVKQDFAYYWYQTGTPAFLVDLLKRNDFDLRQLSGGITVERQTLDDYRPEAPYPPSILYQSGYLTITGYNDKYDEYTLGFPNEEVKYGFLKSLLPGYAPRPRDIQGVFVKNFIKDLDRGDTEAFMNRLKGFFAGIPYELNDKTERHYQMLMYVVFTLMGEFTQAEMRSAAGRADLVVATDTAVYCFEFKLTGRGTAEEALKQIDGRGYLVPFSAAGRKLVKVGAVFDPVTRTLGEWVIE
ncbi:MAG: ATP-binding protein [Treponema sp.]|jgi:hypothetical protein|nr:ATP-binding protein [Treponema sp.]